MRPILSPYQKQFLKLFSQSPLTKTFYFTGGTALSHYYLKHRFSEDLDFFNPKEFDPSTITTFLKSIKNKLKYTTIDIQTSFNRHIFLLKFKQEFLKVEFTYFPFPPIKKPLKKDNLLIDSLTDISVNKLFTINQNPRGRDYYDLYYIFQKKPFSLEKLRKLSKIKFDWHVDPLQLASRLNQVSQFLDDPILVKTTNRSKIVDFFTNQAQQLKSEIIKP